MEIMTSRERIIKALNLQETDRVPLILWLGVHAASVAGISLRDLIFDRRKSEWAWKYSMMYYGGPDMIYGSDIADIPVWLLLTSGSGLCPRTLTPGVDGYPENAPIQILEEPPLMEPEDYDLIIERGIDGLDELVAKKCEKKTVQVGSRKVTMPFETAWIEKEFKTWVPTVQEFERQDVPVQGSAIFVPTDILALARSLRGLVTDLYRRPDKVKRACDRIAQDLVVDALDYSRWLNLQDQSQPRLVDIIPERSSPIYFGPKIFEWAVLPYMKQIGRKLTDLGYSVKWHCDSDWTPGLSYLLEVAEFLPKGKCYFAFAGETDMMKVKKTLGDHVCVSGDVPASLLKLGTPKEVKRYCQKLIRAWSEGGFILANGCEIPLDAKPENVKAMVDVAKSTALRK